MKFGDGNTKLFQTMATMRHTYNMSDGTIVEQHDLKAATLWHSFKERLCISEFHSILFDLSSLIDIVELPSMDHPFTKDEISTALKYMPSDHS